jgi:hypothetical protein
MIVLHDELVRGERSAVVLSALMGPWWTARIAVDACIFGHSDWPRGLRYVAAHALLVLGFVGMSTTYVGVVAIHWSAL